MSVYFGILCNFDVSEKLYGKSSLEFSNNVKFVIVFAFLVVRLIIFASSFCLFQRCNLLLPQQLHHRRKHTSYVIIMIIASTIAILCSLVLRYVKVVVVHGINGAIIVRLFRTPMWFSSLQTANMERKQNRIYTFSFLLSIPCCFPI